MRAQQAQRLISPIAQMQRGFFTSQQAARVDVPRLALSRMEDSGDLERMAHGVYRIAGSDQGQNPQLYAAWLALDPARTAPERIGDKTRMIAASHRSAAEVYGIGNLPAHENMFTTSYRKQVTRPATRVSQRELSSDDVRIEDGMLVTTPERTIADLARSEADLSHVADVLGDALEEKLSTVSKVLDVMPGRSQRERSRIVDVMLANQGLDSMSIALQIMGSTIGTALADDIASSLANALKPLAEVGASLKDSSVLQGIPEFATAFAELLHQETLANIAMSAVTDSLASIAAGPQWDLLWNVKGAAEAVQR